jgi:steroid delta-isomerase-like uncharacterized protein
MDPKSIVRRFYDEVVGHGSAAAADELLDPNLIDHGVPPAFPSGRAGFLQFAASLKAAFPDLRVDVEDLITEGDRVAARVMVRGTHLGPLLGRLNATGRSAAWTGIDMFRLANGRIVERWNERDLLSLLRQLGVDVGLF